MSVKKIKILFFGKSRDLTGLSQKQLDIEYDNIKAEQLFEILISNFPRLVEIRSSVKLSLNEEYVEMEDNIKLKNGDEIAVIPPISGG